MPSFNHSREVLFFHENRAQPACVLAISGIFVLSDNEDFAGIGIATGSLSLSPSKNTSYEL